MKEDMIDLRPEYIIHTNSTHTAIFIDEINKLIKEGYTPLGGVASSRGHLMQAMIKAPKPTEK